MTVLTEVGRDDDDDDSRSVHKFTLPFILNTNVHMTRYVSPSPATAMQQHAAPTAETTEATTRPRAEWSKEEKKRGRMCRTEGCENYIVHKGLCCRHGGGKKCSVPDCTTSAKHRGVCWKHVLFNSRNAPQTGGSTECRVEHCIKRAKAKGLCWGHGGGTKCGNDDCDKVAVSNGFCWAHGGGKRCIYDGCNKPGYERTQNFCVKHHEELQGVNYYEV
uniref:WRKY19-like zinc finger domain-containing protein n=1 Tax=Globisporangium ultimum (strain ATCC 200006 / CBS 805.95 / DAOM BR144) TaxID=431595 RepID=K3XBU6_GLOUD